MGEQPFKRFFRSALTLAGLFSVELFGRGEQRPAPAVFVAVLVYRIDEVLSDDAAGRLQSGHITVETAAHLRPCETTGGTKFSGNKTSMLLQSQQDGFFDTARLGGRVLAAAVVAEVGPPLTADEARLARKELAIDTVTFGHNGTFPFPQRPVPASIGEPHIAAIVAHDFLRREATNAAIEQGQEPDLLDEFRQLRLVVYLRFDKHGLLLGSLHAHLKNLLHVSLLQGLKARQRAATDGFLGHHGEVGAVNAYLGEGTLQLQSIE